MDFESKPKAFSHSISLEIMCLNGGESSQKYGGLTKVGGGGGKQEWGDTVVTNKGGVWPPSPLTYWRRAQTF